MGLKSSKLQTSKNKQKIEKAQFQFKIDALYFQISCSNGLMRIQAFPASKFKTQKLIYDISYTNKTLPSDLAKQVQNVSLLALKINQLKSQLKVKNDQLIINFKNKIFSLPLTNQKKSKDSSIYSQKYFQSKNQSQLVKTPDTKIDEQKQMLKRQIEQLKREKEKLKNPQKKYEGKFDKSDVQNQKQLNNVDKIFKKAQQLYSEQKYKQSEILGLECLKIQEEHPGKISLQYAQTLHLLGRIKFSEQKNDQALNYYIQALQIKQKTIGRYHDRYTATLNNMGLIFKNTQKYDEALQCFYQCLQIEEQIEGKNNQAYMAAIANIGYVYMRQKDYKEALKYLHQFEQNYQKIVYKDPKLKIRNMAVTLQDIGTCYSNLKDNQKCLSYRLKCLNFVGEFQDKHSLQYADKLQGVATTLHLSKQFEQSLIYYLRYIQLMQELKQTKHPTFVMVLCCIIQTYEALGDMQSIVPICLKIIHTCEENKDIDNETYLYGMDMLAKFLYDQKQYSQSLAMYKKLQTILSIIDKNLHQNYRANIKANVKAAEDALKSSLK